VAINIHVSVVTSSSLLHHQPGLHVTHAALFFLLLPYIFFFVLPMIINSDNDDNSDEN